MPRNLSLHREEAELLTDLLMLTDEWPALEIDEELRQQWGMGTREQELESRKKSLAQIRLEWSDQIISEHRKP